MNPEETRKKIRYLSLTANFPSSLRAFFIRCQSLPLSFFKLLHLVQMNFEYLPKRSKEAVQAILEESEAFWRKEQLKQGAFSSISTTEPNRWISLLFFLWKLGEGLLKETLIQLIKATETMSQSHQLFYLISKQEGQLELLKRSPITERGSQETFKVIFEFLILSEKVLACFISKLMRLPLGFLPMGSFT